LVFPWVDFVIPFAVELIANDCQLCHVSIWNFDTRKIEPTVDQRRKVATASSAVSWLIPTLTQPGCQDTGNMSQAQEEGFSLL